MQFRFQQIFFGDSVSFGLNYWRKQSRDVKELIQKAAFAQVSDTSRSQEAKMHLNRSNSNAARVCDRAIMPDRSRSPVTGACCLRTGAYTFDRAIMPGEAGPEPTTVIGPSSS